MCVAKDGKNAGARTLEAFVVAVSLAPHAYPTAPSAEKCVDAVSGCKSVVRTDKERSAASPKSKSKYHHLPSSGYIHSTGYTVKKIGEMGH